MDGCHGNGMVIALRSPKFISVSFDVAPVLPKTLQYHRFYLLCPRMSSKWSRYGQFTGAVGMICDKGLLMATSLVSVKSPGMLSHVTSMYILAR